MTVAVPGQGGVIEHDPKHGYGYISVTRVGAAALLTYYDWPDNGQRDFHTTSLRQRRSCPSDSTSLVRS